MYYNYGPPVFSILGEVLFPSLGGGRVGPENALASMPQIQAAMRAITSVHDLVNEPDMKACLDGRHPLARAPGGCAARGGVRERGSA